MAIAHSTTGLDSTFEVKKKPLSHHKVMQTRILRYIHSIMHHSYCYGYRKQGYTI